MALRDSELQSPLFRIPIELRLAIYEFALIDSPNLTIGSGEVNGRPHEVVHRLYGEGRVPFEGIPQNHEPVILPNYDASLLSITQPAKIPATSKLHNDAHKYSTHASLLLTSRQIKEELTNQLKLPRNRQTSVFMSFPYGLHIAKKITPRLLQKAQSIHLAGSYIPRNYDPMRRAAIRRGEPPIDPNVKHNGNTLPDPIALLEQLISSTFGRNPTYHIRKLEMRIYYSGDDSYSTVWSDDDSPIVIALKNISIAEVDIEVWRGPKGTGIHLSATPTTQRKRVVSTVWRKLEEGRVRQAACGSWVVDPKWPEWDSTYEQSEGSGATVVTTRAAEPDATAGASAEAGLM